jgi:hypothetical protein
MAAMVPSIGKETTPTATITLGQIIGMQFKSTRRESVLKRTNRLPRRREAGISEPMTIETVRQQAGACLTLAGERPGGGGVAVSLLSGMD